MLCRSRHARRSAAHAIANRLETTPPSRLPCFDSRSNAGARRPGQRGLARAQKTESGDSRRKAMTMENANQSIKVTDHFIYRCGMIFSRKPVLTFGSCLSRSLLSLRASLTLRKSPHPAQARRRER